MKIAATTNAPRLGQQGFTRVPLKERLEKYIRKTDACWLWTGYKRAGYGRIAINGHQESAHRIVYILAKGPIPDGLRLDHLCRNVSCVNPEHLEPVTGRINTLRGLTLPAFNAAKTNCPQGHLYSPENTRLTNNGRNRHCRTCDASRLRNG